jgi:hypothetical protein
MFLWSFWYIIYIFLILYEIVMNFQSIAYFLELWNNRQTLIVPRLGLPIATDRWGLAMSTAMLAADQVKIFDRPGKLTAGSQSSTAAMLYSPRERAAWLFWIGTSRGTNWQRRPLEKVTGASSGEPICGSALRPDVDSVLTVIKWCKWTLWRCARPSRTWWCAERWQWWMEPSVLSWTPVVGCKRERPDSHNSELLFSINPAERIT